MNFIDIFQELALGSVAFIDFCFKFHWFLP